MNGFAIPNDEPEHHVEDDVPSIHRAHQVIARVDALLATPRPDPAAMWRAPEPEPAKPDPPKPVSRSQPVLSPVVVDAIGQALARERKLMREHVEKRMGEVAAVIGEETAKREKELREQFRREIDGLKLELAELRGFARGVASQSEDTPLPKFLRSRDAASH